MKEKNHMKKNMLRLVAVLGVLALALAPIVMYAGTSSGVRLESTVRATVAGTIDAGTLSWNVGSSGVKVTELSNGTGANAINKVFVDNACTGTNYDLDAGTLLDPTGSALTFSRIVYVRVVPDTDNVAELDVTGDFVLTKYLQANGDTLANVSIPVKVDGHFEFSAPDATGVAVTAGTGDVITVTPSGVECYDILILGS